MIPDFDPVTGNLPGGERAASWHDVLERFGHTPWRGQLLAGMLLTFDRSRATQKAAFLGELFIADARADPQGTLFRDFFQTDRDGRRKGIVVIHLKDLP